jgi:hypothetical protein
MRADHGLLYVVFGEFAFSLADQIDDSSMCIDILSPGGASLAATKKNRVNGSVSFQRPEVKTAKYAARKIHCVFDLDIQLTVGCGSSPRMRRLLCRADRENQTCAMTSQDGAARLS